MNKEYYYAREGQQLGPVSVAEIQDLLRNNQLAPTDLVWAEEMPDWQAAAEVPGLVPKPAAVLRPESNSSTKFQPAPPSEQPSAPSAAARLSANAGTNLLHTVRRKLLQFLTTASSTAVVTSGHLKQFIACLIARGRIGLAQREAVRQRAALGRKMYNAGSGDVDSRRIIDDIERRIRNAESAGHSKRSLEQELQAAHAAIAESAMDTEQAPAGLEHEFEVARTARQGLLTVQQAATDRRSSLRLLQSSQGLRIGIGYACAFLIISSMVWAARGTGRPATKPNGPNQSGNVVNDNQGGEPGGDQGGGGGDAGGFVPNPNPDPEPEAIPNLVSSNEKSTCQNCFGTGQADCTVCFGQGKRTCSQCNGTGRPPSAPNIQCFQCNGTGQQKCFSCNYGKVQCPQCFGSGKR